MNPRSRPSLRFVRNLVVGLAALGGLAVDAPAAAAPARPVVITDYGPVRGVTDDGMKKFLGLPYAAPPIGTLRWAPPAPPARWRTPRDASRFAPHCAQGASPFGTFSLSEDCLYLNVYTPAKLDHGVPHRLPVMVWIHGGALVVGQSDTYDPRKLVDRGVVVVTINYRLGVLGYLAHPALTEENGVSGNYGFLDQQAALRWVRDNIDRFGGDPTNVTVFGESAGGLSTHVQLASPLAAGLFHRAIVESGAYDLQQASLEDAEDLGTALAVRVGCPAQTLACLRAVPVATLLADPAARAIAAPVVDGRVLTQSIATAFATGDFNQVPVIEGSNHDEWRLFLALDELAGGAPLTDADYLNALAALGLPPIVAALYPLDNFRDEGDPEDAASLALGAIITDVTFACPSRTAAQLLSAHVPTWAYEFADRNAPLLLPPVSFPQGAYHAAEIQYLFVDADSQLNAAQRTLSDHMVRYWTTFARFGSPNASGSPHWPAYQPAADEIQSLVPPVPQVTAGFAADHKCAIWAGG